jgi:hypothetical protein
VPFRLALAVALLVAFTATPTAGGAARLPGKPVVSAWLTATGPGASIRAAGRTVALPRGERVRLEARRGGTRLRVALAERRWSGPAAGGIRIRGPVTVTRLLGTGPSIAELVAHRLTALEPALHGAWAPDGSAPSGRIRRTKDWKRGFYAGALWRAIEAAPATRPTLEPLAWRATRALWGGEGEDTHDVGFIFGEADGGALRVACDRPSRDCDRAAASLRQAAATLHRLAAATPAWAIPVQAQQGCRICRGDELKVYIDSAMNLTPLLAGTDQDRALADHHLAFLTREMVRSDGSTTQQLLLGAATGDITRKLGHDPLAPDSTWARGQAWAVRGYAEAAPRLGGAQDIAERTADWIARRTTGAPGWDWNAKLGRRNPLDTSAAAIAAAGLERLTQFRCTAATATTAPLADPDRCAAWGRASDLLLARAIDHVSRAPGTLGRFHGQRYLWDPARRIDYRGEYTMGTVYLLEALASRRGSRTEATTRSTAAGASGATSAAARSR